MKSLNYIYLYICFALNKWIKKQNEMHSWVVDFSEVNSHLHKPRAVYSMWLLGDNTCMKR